MAGQLGSTDYWISRWTNSTADWHTQDVHRFIQENFEDICQGKMIKILFPMCGKSVDMATFADKGHTVVGVECAAQACQEFFTEHQTDYTLTEDIPGWDGSLYQSKNGAIKIYCGDFFKFSSLLEGGFNAVWDRGGFGSIGAEYREEYCKVMSQSGLLDTRCRFYMETFNYDQRIFTGPPFSIAYKDLAGYFRDFSVTKVDQRVCEYEMFKGIPVVFNIYLLDIKQAGRDQ